MPVVISVMPGGARIGRRARPMPAPSSPARSICFSRLTRSTRREASSQDCKPVTITCCRTVLSSALRSTLRFRLSQFQAFPSAALRASSPTLGAESYSETVLSSGTVRARIGYAPGNWLFYATGGFAWTYDQLTLTQLASGTTDSPSCGDWAGRPAPASRSRWRRTGPRSSNICSQTTATAA